MPKTKRKMIGRWFGRRTLSRQLFVLFVAFSLGPLFISNVWGYLQSRSFWTDAVFRDVRHVAAMQADKTLDTITKKLELLPTIVAGNEHLFDLLAAIESVSSESDRRPLYGKLGAHLAAKAQEIPSAEQFLVLSAKGVLLGSSLRGQSLPVDMSDSSCFNSGLTTSELTGFEYGGEEPTLVVAAPIRNKSNELIGIFCAKFRFDVHHALVAANHELNSYADVYLIGADGHVVCGSFEEHGDSAGHREPPYGQTLPDRPEHKPSGSESWVDRYPTGSGDVIAAFVPIRELDWGILVEVPVKDALAGLERLKWQAVTVSGLLAVILSVVVFLIARKLTRHMNRLSEAAKRIAGGALGEKVPAEGPEEVVDLANAFNQMSLALQDSHHNLEGRIAERTRELQDSQEFTELLLNSIEQRVVVVGADYKIIKANLAARRLYGDNVVGRFYDEVFEENADGSSPSPVRRTFETGEVVSVERSERTLRGQEVLLLETYPVVSREGRVQSVIEIGRITTTEKQMQAQSIYHEKMAAFGLLAAGVAHELGNPLAAIQMKLRATRKIKVPPAVQESLEIVDDHLARMNRLLRELVDFSRRKRDEVAVVSINRVISDVVRLLRHDPRARRVEISESLNDTLSGLVAREDALVQVLLNLGLNALDAMPEGGRLVFETSTEAGQITLRVSDNGGGIPEDVRESVFEPFFTTKAPGHGTGMGLFVSKALIDELNGSLVIERTGSTGTVFTMRFNVGEQRSDGAGRSTA